MNSGGGARTCTVKCAKCLKPVVWNIDIGQWEHVDNASKCRYKGVPIAGEAR